MPLLAYFGTVGVLLTALLLFVNAMLEPDKPKNPNYAPARVETSLPQPRTTTGLTQRAAGVAQAQAAPAIEIRQEPTSPTTPLGMTPSAYEQQPQMNSDEGERKSFKATKPKNKTARIHKKRRTTDTASRPYREQPGYSSYAQGRPPLPFFVGRW